MAAASTAAAFRFGSEFVALAIFAPLFIFPPIGTVLLSVIVLMPLIWIRRDPLPLTPFNGALALLVLMVLVSCWATYDIFFSAGKILGTVFGVAVFFAIVRQLEDCHRLQLALHTFIGAGLALAVIGILGTNWIGKVPVIGSVTSHIPAVIRGVPGQTEGFQPNAIAGALVMFIPLQIAVCITARGTRLAFHSFALALTAGTVILTQSRNGWLSLLAALLAWAVWQWRRSRLVVLVLIVAGIFPAALFRYRMISFVESEVGGGIRNDIAGRTELWSRAVNAIKDFPMTGMGMNTFRRVMPVLYPTLPASPDADVAHAHNAILQTALDLGLPGLVAYLAIWIGIANLLWRTCRAGTQTQRLIASGLAAGMLAYFFFGIADAIALGAKVGIFFWIALALIVGVHRDVARQV